MKLEIDIPSILYNDAKNNRRYISVNKMEIAWKAIADGKPLEQESTTKNNLGVDCISRAEAIKCLECDFDITGKENMKTVVNYINSAHDKIVNLPSVTPQEPFINKSCVSSGVCAHDKQKVLDKIRAEIEQITDTMGVSYNQYVSKIDVLAILDKYKADRSEMSNDEK